MAPPYVPSRLGTLFGFGKNLQSVRVLGNFVLYDSDEDGLTTLSSEFP